MKYTHATGAIAYERFASDGEMVLLVEMQGEGTYVLSARPGRRRSPDRQPDGHANWGHASGDEHQRSGHDLSSPRAECRWRTSSLVLVTGRSAYGDAP
jgi:hypothetical protein